MSGLRGFGQPTLLVCASAQYRLAPQTLLAAMAVITSSRSSYWSHLRDILVWRNAQASPTDVRGRRGLSQPSSSECISDACPVVSSTQ